jgi:hypothetical protein
MRNLYIILFALAILAITYRIVGNSTAEGFSSLPHVKQGNYVLDLIGRLKKTSSALANPGLWKERMAYIGKSPVELARAYIKSQGAGAP